MVLGHLVGDFLLQDRTMALRKSEPGHTGLGWCLLHCVFYTASVGAFLWTAGGHVTPTVASLVFASHYPIDRWSLASPWLRLVRGRDFKAALALEEPYRTIDVAFSAVVYTVADNTMHLVLLWFLALAMERGVV
jgi:hypothetical protein